MTTTASTSSNRNRIPRRRSSNKSKNHSNTTLTSTLKRPPTLPVIATSRREDGRGGVDGMRENNTPHHTPMSLISSLDPMHPTQPLQSRVDECCVLQGDIYVRAGVRPGVDCNCYACGGNVKSHDEGPSNLSPLHAGSKNKNDKGDLNSRVDASTSSSRSNSRHRGRPVDADVEKEWKPPHRHSRSRSSQPLSFSRGYGAKSGHEEKGGDDECVNPPKRSSRGRSRHYDDDDENDEERSRSRSKTNSNSERSSQSHRRGTTSIPAVTAYGDDGYSRANSVISGRSWNDSKRLMQARRERHALRDFEKLKREQSNARISPVTESSSSGQKTDMVYDLVSPEDNVSVYGFPVVGRKAPPVNYKELRTGYHYPLHMILKRDRKRRYSSRNSSVFMKRYAKIAEKYSVLWNPKHKEEMKEFFQPDFQKFADMSVDTEDETLRAQMLDRVNACPFSFDYFVATSTIDMEAHCEYCGIVKKAHLLAAPCSLSEDEVMLTMNKNVANNRCAICCCLAGAHAKHDHKAQEKAGVYPTRVSPTTSSSSSTGGNGGSMTSSSPLSPTRTNGFEIADDIVNRSKQVEAEKRERDENQLYDQSESDNENAGRDLNPSASEEGGTMKSQ